MEGQQAGKHTLQKIPLLCWSILQDLQVRVQQLCRELQRLAKLLYLQILAYLLCSRGMLSWLLFAKHCIIYKFAGLLSSPHSNYKGSRKSTIIDLSTMVFRFVFGADTLQMVYCCPRAITANALKAFGLLACMCWHSPELCELQCGLRPQTLKPTMR